ncbi:unnamed protein product, partial [Iphiclides podalirius]
MPSKVGRFLEVVANMSLGYRTSNILVTMGEDFQYQDAAMWFQNLDKLIQVRLMSEAYRSNNILVTMGDDFQYKDAGMWFKNLDKLIQVGGQVIVVTSPGCTQVGKFLEYVREMGARYRSGNVLVTMGGDFTYQDAAMWFTNLDKLIQYTNLKAAKDGLNVKLFYSTPDCYLKAVKDAYPSLPTKQDDFFPYASDPTAYWTGYFTSRPTTKYFERRGNTYLQMVKQLQVLANLPEHNMFVLDELKSAMGVMQHHDAITGTEKQHVANDYVRLLDSAIEDANIIAKQAFNKITQRDGLKPPLLIYERCALNESSCHVSETKRSFVVTVYNPLAWKVSEPIRVPVVEGSYAVFAPNGEEITSQLIDIPQAVVEIPTRVSSATHELVFLAYLHPLGLKSYYVTRKDKNKRDANPEGQRSDYYENLKGYWSDIKWKSYLETLLVKTVGKQTVKAAHVDATAAQKAAVRDKALPAGRGIPDAVARSKESLMPIVRDVDLDVLRDSDEVVSEDVLELQKIIREAKGAGTRQRESAKRLNYPRLNDEEMRMLSDDPLVVEAFGEAYIQNEYIKLRIDNGTGRLSQLTQKNTSLDLSVDLHSYSGHGGDNSNTSMRASGAYIFRPAGDPRKLAPRSATVRSGPLVSEVRVRLDGNAASTLRLYEGLDYTEHEFVAGPLPVDDAVGKEYVARYESGVRSGRAFYTDCNGRQALRRRRDERPQWNLTLEEPVAGNYYPVTEFISIEDESTRLTVLTDRSEGGSSLAEGQIELMLHRRLLYDDAFGVGEALNETAAGLGLVVRGSHRILVGASKVEERKRTLEFHYRPVVFFSDAERLKYVDWLALNNMFQGVRKPLPDGIHLLTLEPWKDGTLLLRLENYLERADDSTVEVDLGTLFNSLKIRAVRETTLAANQWLSDSVRWTWKTDEFSDPHEPLANSDQGTRVKIAAKQIRTFVVEYEHSDGQKRE